jgi:hypothetical protein
MLTELLMWINMGANNNILVYDCNAQASEFTKKLVLLMKHIAIQDGKQPLDRIYVSETDFITILDWNYNSADIINTRDHDKNFYEVRVAGVHIVPVKELNDKNIDFKLVENPVLMAYKALGGSLQCFDNKLVIGVSKDNTNVLLGSY